MKALLIVMLCAGSVWADQAADSFGTGFAQAIQRAIERRQQSSSNQWQAEMDREQELNLLKEQVELQRQELELQQREHREQMLRDRK